MQDVLRIIHTDICLYEREIRETQRRKQNYLEQCAEQGIKFVVKAGVTGFAPIFKNISKAHKRIVFEANVNGMERVVIAEDDIKFTAPGAWKYFIENIPEDFDLYMGVIYAGEVVDQRVVNGFSGGLTLYVVHQRFYDFFLSVREDDHIDRVLGESCSKFKYMVPPKYVCKQSTGYSFNKMRHATYGAYEEGKEFFK